MSKACACYSEAAKLVEETKAKKCSAVSDFNKLRDAKKTCLEKFSACKAAEDDTIGIIHACNGGTTPVPPSTSTETTESSGSSTSFPSMIIIQLID